MKTKIVNVKNVYDVNQTNVLEYTPFFNINNDLYLMQQFYYEIKGTICEENLRSKFNFIIVDKLDEKMKYASQNFKGMSEYWIIYRAYINMFNADFWMKCLGENNYEYFNMTDDDIKLMNNVS